MTPQAPDPDGPNSKGPDSEGGTGKYLTDASHAQRLQIGEHHQQIDQQTNIGQQTNIFSVTRAAVARRAVWLPREPPALLAGRAELLNQLNRQLTRPSEPGEAGGVCRRVLVGLGGVGKSSLAAAYATRHLADYTLVWWIPAAEPAAVGPRLAQLLADQLEVRDGVLGTHRLGGRRPRRLVPDRRGLDRRVPGQSAARTYDAPVVAVGDASRPLVYSGSDSVGCQIGRGGGSLRVSGVPRVRQAMWRSVFDDRSRALARSVLGGGHDVRRRRVTAVVELQELLLTTDTLPKFLREVAYRAAGEVSPGLSCGLTARWMGGR